MARGRQLATLMFMKLLGSKEKAHPVATHADEYDSEIC